MENKNQTAIDELNENIAKLRRELADYDDYSADARQIKMIINACEIAISSLKANSGNY